MLYDRVLYDQRQCMIRSSDALPRARPPFYQYRCYLVALMLAMAIGGADVAIYRRCYYSFMQGTLLQHTCLHGVILDITHTQHTHMSHRAFNDVQVKDYG